MKAKHRNAYRVDALATLALCKIHVGADFMTLTGAQVEALAGQADIRRYQKPKGANGSRLRYFHDMLQRRADY